MEQTKEVTQPVEQERTPPAGRRVLSPQDFYRKLVKRRDIREILGKLAKW